MSEITNEAIAEPSGIVISPDDVQAYTFDSWAFKMFVQPFYKELGFDREPQLQSETEGDDFETLGYTPVRVIDSVNNKKIIAGLLNRDEVEGLNYKGFDNDEAKSKGALAVAIATFELIKSHQLDLDEPGIADKLRVLLKNKGYMKFVSEDSAIDTLIDLYGEYDAMLKEDGLVTFADMIPLALKVMDMHPEYLPSLKYNHVMVDEFQDTNPIQMEIVRRLKACGTESTMVVGDDMQSIYGFRGATPEIFLNYEEEFGHPVKDLFMEGNFRSTEEILAFGNAIQVLNVNKVDKKLVCATGKPGMEPLVRGFHKKEKEYEFIAETIQKKIEEGYDPSDIAILTATRDEGIQVSQYLEKYEIPFVIMNPMYMIENSRVKAALALCNAFYEPEATKLYFTYMAAKYDGELFNLRTPEEIMAEVEDFRREFSNMENLDFADQQRKLHQYLNDIKGTDEIYEAFLELLYNNPDFPSELQYSQDFQLYGKKEEKKMEQKYEGVAVCTAHSSKGLEWPIVFNTITKYDKKQLHRGHASDDAVEEVRRLLFVSMTRAREELYVTSQYKAYGSEAEGITYNQFLKELYDIKGMAFDPVDHEAIAEKAAKEEAAKAKRREIAAAKKAAKATAANEFGLTPRIPYKPAGTGRPNKTVQIPQRNKSSYGKDSSSKVRELTDDEKNEYDTLVAGATQTSVMDWI